MSFSWRENYINSTAHCGNNAVIDARAFYIMSNEIWKHFGRAWIPRFTRWVLWIPKIRNLSYVNMTNFMWKPFMSNVSQEKKFCRPSRSIKDMNIFKINFIAELRTLRKRLKNSLVRPDPKSLKSEHEVLPTSNFEHKESFAYLRKKSGNKIDRTSKAVFWYFFHYQCVFKADDR